MAVPAVLPTVVAGDVWGQQLVDAIASLHLGPDTHANIPAANAVPPHSVYACTSHATPTLHQTNGTTWIDYFVGGSGVGGSGGSGTASIWTAGVNLPLSVTTGLNLFSGTWAISGGVLAQSSTAASEGRAIATAAVMGAMSAAEVEVRFDAIGGSTQRVGLDLYVQNGGGSAGTVLYLQVNGANVDLIAECAGTAVVGTVASVAAYSTSAWIKLTAIYTPGGIEAYVNGTLVGIFGSQPYRTSLAMYAGLYTYTAAASFRNLKTWKIAAPAVATAVSSYPPGSADIHPASPNAKDDEFDGTSAVTWTATPTAANAFDINTTRSDHAYIKASGSGNSFVGKTQPVPGAYPYTATLKMVSSTARGNYHRAGGLILGPAAPTGTSAIVYCGSIYDTGNHGSSGRGVNRTTETFAGTFSSAATFRPFIGHWGALYLRMTVASATSMSTFASSDGFSWVPIETGLNPGFTPGVIGFACSEANAGGGVESYFEWFRVT